jgi:hypothetical protein
MCWRNEYRNTPQCQEFRRNFVDPQDYQCNINAFDIQKHKDYPQYIRRDKIPCWNCNLTAPIPDNKPLDPIFSSSYIKENKNTQNAVAMQQRQQYQQF